MIQEKTWADYYKGRVCNSEYDKYFCKKYGRFLSEIILKIKLLSNSTGHPLIVREEGCGIGSVYRNISNIEDELLSILEIKPSDKQPIEKIIFSDLSFKMLKLCLENTNPSIPAFYTCENIKVPKFYEPRTAIITHGVLEHFEDDDIEQILKNYSNKNVIFQAHYVPTNKYRAPSYGDERLMSAEYWINLVSPDYSILDNGGCDLYMFKTN